jgi:hypothetical protein
MQSGGKIMKIVALYKTWSGEEWLKASIESIYKYCYKIVLLTSNISWIGGRDNPSLPIIKEIRECHDPENKISHVEHDEPNQLNHCMFGYKYIQDNLECDYIQLIDSDELWDNENYEKAIDFIKKNSNQKAYRTKMYTYLKSPFYRVDPPEALSPVCFIRPDLKDMGMEPRGCAIKPFVMMSNVYCHHFVFVRYHFNKVLEKLIQSHVSEKQPYENMSKWIPEVWNKIPNYNKKIFPNGMHPAIGFGHQWKNILKINIHKLPEVLHNRRYPEILNFGR